MGHVPEWASDAVWYQMMVQFFRNGDPGNDPTIDMLEGTWPFDQPDGWEPFPMNTDLWTPQPWEKTNGESIAHNFHCRRWGGDFQGVIDKLDYLTQLGINAIYFCPLFEAPAYHGYDTEMYHHTIRFYGPDPQGDKELYKEEESEDPASWVWTAADKKFVELLAEAHRRGIKIIVDGVFTYVGHTYWDERIKGKNPPSTTEFREYVKAVVEKWGDPNGDGDPSDGIDGWRLDIGLALPHDFIREFRTWVRDVNKDALLVVESWYDQTHFVNAAPWLQGDMYDSHMNYMFGDAMIRSFVDAEDQITPSEMDIILRSIRVEYPVESQYALQNLIGTHDTRRFVDMIMDPSGEPHYYMVKYTLKSGFPYSFQIDPTHKYAIRPGNQGEAARKLVPTEYDRQIQKSILLFQYCYLGAPYVYMGDETGIWYDTRSPVIWDDINYEIRQRLSVKPAVDMEILDFYKALGKMRKEEDCLRKGSYNTVILDDERSLFVFERRMSRKERIRAVFNISGERQEVDAIVEYLQPLDPYKIGDGKKSLEWELIAGDPGDLNVLPPKGSRVYKFIYNPENENKMFDQ